ncbi:MAG: NAD-dependent epimerase/dehydratase family protein, partial [Candidatus Dormibacteraeota bacterium]|nr:NAD-dependent epimerase/dehydratase family protein [Candidatus Dormibacteraeota bacterium]
MTGRTAGRPLAVVTGAAGFIGSWLSEALLAAGWHVRGVDSLTRAYDPAMKRANVAALAAHPAFSFVQADLACTASDELLGGADAVIHLAAEPRSSSSWGASFSRYIERNVLVTEQLLDSAAAMHVWRFIYASSASVYGSSSVPLSESAVPHPVNPYAASKLAGEHVAGVHASQGLPVVILRYFSVYGPRQRPDMAVHQFVAAALDRRPLTIAGSGAQVRDMTYVGDAVAATVAALQAPLAPGSVINVAGGHPLTMRQLAYEVAAIAGHASPEIIEEPARDGDVMHCVASTDLARSALGWTPVTALSEGLRRQVEWQAERRRELHRQEHATGSRPMRAQPRGPRLMIYSQDGLGLGHLRRASSIASAFLEREPSGWVLTTSDSPMGTLLHDVHNHDYLKLPSIVKSGPGDWHPLSFPLDFAHLRQLRTRLILEAANAFEPDVLLVDHMPHGAMGEMLPVLEALRGESAQIILGLRDILDAPEIVHQRWEQEGAFEALSRYYDGVLVYGSREVFDVCREYGWPQHLADLVRYCGFICTPQTPEDARRIRARRLGGADRGTMIAAMAGGGADAHELMSALLDALALIHADQPCVLEIVTGPFMPDHQRLDLKRRAESLPVRLRRMVSDPLSRVAAADLVVAMAGYNTTMEVLRLG